MDTEKGETIPTNLRLLLVIEEIAQAGVPVTPTAVNELLGLPRPTIHRLFSTLEDEGFLQRNLDGRTFTPGPRLRLLAGGVLSFRHIRTARQAILAKLSRQIGETCNIAQPQRNVMTFLEQIETGWPLRIHLPIGASLPLYCTACGKMYLSSLPASHLERYLAATDLAPRTKNTLTSPEAILREIEALRRNGYALDREEFMPDMIALAVPVTDTNGRLMATLSFHAPTQRLNVVQALDFLEPLREAACDLSKLIIDDGEA